jgi:regulator of protease activity HflC (stomatin/prohibitin superfamily)
MRWDYEVSALSKEGIPVTVSVDVTFQIDTGDNVPSDSIPYPALNEAVFKASTCRWMRPPGGSEDDQYFDWARRLIISNTEGDLRGIIARYPLDALVGLENISASGQEIPRKAIQKELEKKLQKSCSSLGAQINQVWLGTIKVHDEVAEQWLEVWRNEWRYWSLVQKKTGEAKRQQLREVAKAQAQVDLIVGVARAFQQSASRDTRTPSRLLAMRLLEVFDRSAVGPYTYLPGQALETLESLRKMVR